jgi:hypothetical protein
MKLTKSQLKRLIKEELEKSLDEIRWPWSKEPEQEPEPAGSFFGAEEEEMATIKSKKEFRKFKKSTNNLLDKLRILQNEKKSFVRASYRGTSEHGPGGKHYKSVSDWPNWQRMLSKLIAGLERNLQQLSGPKGTHRADAAPLSETSPPTTIAKRIVTLRDTLAMLKHYYDGRAAPFPYLSGEFRGYIKSFSDLTHKLWDLESEGMGSARYTKIR